jgi:transcriptional regulator with XRE-family HTH domain
VSADLIVRQLRAARLAARRSQQSVADEIGINQSNVSDWENGVTTPMLSSLRSWARALEHDVVLLPEGARVVVDVPPPGRTLPWPDFNPAHRVTRCGQSSAHGPHFMDHGPDQPRNCPGTGRAAWEAYQRWAAENRGALSTEDGAAT